MLVTRQDNQTNGGDTFAQYQVNLVDAPSSYTELKEQLGWCKNGYNTVEMSEGMPIGFRVRLTERNKNNELLNQAYGITPFQCEQYLEEWLDDWMESQFETSSHDWQYPTEWRIDELRAMYSETSMTEYIVSLISNEIDRGQPGVDVYPTVELTIPLLTGQVPCEETFKQECWSWISRGYDILHWELKDEALLVWEEF